MMFMLKLLVNKQEMFLFLIFGAISGASFGILVVNSEMSHDAEKNPHLLSLPLVESNQYSPYFYPTDNPDPDLRMDQAKLVVSSRISERVTFAAQSDVCYRCPLLNISNIDPQKNQTLIVDTQYRATFQLSVHVNHSYSEIICRIRHHFDQHGNYSLWVNPNHTSSTEDPVCNFYLQNSPSNSNIPIYAAIGIFIFLAVVWIFLKSFYKRGLFNRFIWWNRSDPETLINSDLGSPMNPDDAHAGCPESPTDSVPAVPTRLKSLDTFRGISLVVMIFVNYSGGGYWFFRHSAWNGLTVADLVFPWFVFIMGTSMALSFRSALRRGVSRWKLIFKVLKRTAILFLFGLMISNASGKGKKVDLSTLRIPGVLQRLALTYMIVGLVEALLAKSHDNNSHKWWFPIRDIIGNTLQWLIAFAFIIIHCCIMFLLPVPGCPKGYLGPGGIQDGGLYENCTGGAAAYIDRLIFGPNHMYGHSTCQRAYQTSVSVDPEGALGILTSVVICFLGLQAGKVITIYLSWKQRVSRFLFWSFLTGLAAGVLCKFSKEDGWIPVNKNLWSLSYVLALASMAFFLLAACYLLVDVFRIWSGAPFFFTGMNSIAIYMLHEILHYYFPVQFKVGDTHAEQLAMNLYGTSIWVIVSIMLHQHKIFIAI